MNHKTISIRLIYDMLGYDILGYEMLGYDMLGYDMFVMLYSGYYSLVIIMMSYLGVLNQIHS